MSVIFAAIGAAIFLLLGIAHWVFTAQSSPTGGPMMPLDPATIQAMSVEGGLGMAPEISSSLYQAWIGFNYSHALGVIVTAGVLLRQVLNDFTRAVSEPWFLVVAVAVPIIYLVLAQKYWFAKPRDGIAFGTVLLWIGIIIELL